MNKLILVFGLLVLMSSCGRKTVPVTSKPPEIPKKTLPQSKTDPRVIPAKDSAVVIHAPVRVDSSAIKPTVVYNKVFTVVDSHGRLLLSPDSMPEEISPDWITLKSLRSFTPAQAQTMASRYNIVPPRVIYVPSQLSKSGRKGKYYIYSHKFWYWQKTDGLFYLDTNYYQ